jgi:hypothetical protein
MDVPMNHWAYDAIGQLAAHGILSGYPDGTYKGKQPTTRYEMASALARALAVVDMTKASRQDVEMLQKLVVEFHDELDALGVTVADLEGKVSLLDKRLGGWYIHGRLRLDVYNNSSNNAPTPDGDIFGANFRLWIERFFGEDEQYHFVSRIDRVNTNTIRFTQFYVDMPFFFDSTFTAGKFGWEFETPYYLGGTFGLPEVGEHGLDDVLTDRNVEGLGITKQFGLGEFKAYIAHPNGSFVNENTVNPANNGLGFGAWEVTALARMQFTEQFGFDLGGNAFIGDNAEPANPVDGDSAFDNVWTIFGGLRFDFNENIGFRGIYYHQQMNGDDYNGGAWFDKDLDSTKHWRVIFAVKQEALKFTSAWLEYGQADAGFYSPVGGDAFFFEAQNGGKLAGNGYSNKMMEADLKYWRIALGQVWNDKWATHLFYSSYDFDDAMIGSDGLENEWGVGVRYTYSPAVSFGLQYTNVGYDQVDDDHVIRFRTQVVF